MIRYFSNSKYKHITQQGRQNNAHFGYFLALLCGIVLRIVTAIVPLLEIYVYNSITTRLHSDFICVTVCLYVFRSNGILHLAFAKR